MEFDRDQVVGAFLRLTDFFPGTLARVPLAQRARTGTWCGSHFGDERFKCRSLNALLVLNWCGKSFS
jgi:hypothetical protein